MQQKTNRLLIAGAAFFYLLIAIFHLASANAGYSYYRDIHVGAALEYAKGHIDILRPVIVGFNATGTPTPQELPIWQALAGAVFKGFGMWFGWANLLSLLLFATGLWPLYHLAKQYMGERGACWSLIFFLAQPLLIMMSGQASPDGLSLALSIWFLYFAVKLIRTGATVWLLPSIVVGALCAVTKLPLFMATGLTSFLLLLLHAPRNGKLWALLIATGTASGVLFMGWTRYTDSCLTLAEFPFVDLKLTCNSPMWFWYFGNWNYRLNPFNWVKGGWAMLNSLFGSFALVAPAAWALLFSSNALAKRWLIAAFVTTLIFSHLVLMHRHYYILFSPAIAMLGADGVVRMEELLNLRQGWQRSLAGLSVCGILCLAAVQGLIGMEVVLNYDPYPHRMAHLVDEYTKPEDKLLIAGGGWGGEVLILSQRRGLSIWNAKMLEDKKTLDRLQALGYNKLGTDQ